MKLSDTQIAKAYGISKSNYSGKSPELRQQIRAFVEAGGDKALEDALCLLQRQVYRASVTLGRVFTIYAGRDYVTVDMSGIYPGIFSANKSAKEVNLLATGKITNLIKAG